MDTAIYQKGNEKIEVKAQELKIEYKTDLELAKASKNKLLFCCKDENCPAKILIYKGAGEIKSPHFAHKNLNGQTCEYDEFSKKHKELITPIKNALYNHFTNNGHNVEIDKKIGSKYVHLIIDNKVAIYIAKATDYETERASYINEKCKEERKTLEVFVIGNPDRYFDEERTYLIKRFALNELNKLYIISKDASKISKCIFNKNTKEISRKELTIKDLKIKKIEEKYMNIKFKEAIKNIENAIEFITNNNPMYQDEKAVLEYINLITKEDSSEIEKIINLSTEFNLSLDYIIGENNTPVRVKTSSIPQKKKITPCPDCKKGCLVLKQSREGKYFYGHEDFPKNSCKKTIPTNEIGDINLQTLGWKPK